MQVARFAISEMKFIVRCADVFYTQNLLHFNEYGVSESLGQSRSISSWAVNKSQSNF